jgi:hypothetical protein
MITTRFIILVTLIIFSATCFAQRVILPGFKLKNLSAPTNTKPIIYNKYHHLDDSLSISMINGVCKNRSLTVTKNDLAPSAKGDGNSSTTNKEPLLTLHGNILYNFNYRSYIDTPFKQYGMIQHMVQTYVNGDVAGKYPFRAIFTYRGSNSPYFSNNSDISVQYRQPDMLEQVKSDLRKDADSLVDKNLLINPSTKYNMDHLNMGDTAAVIPAINKNPFIKKLHHEFDSLYAIYQQKREKLDSLEAMANNKDLSQTSIEAQEAALYKKQIPATDTLTDSLDQLKNMWGAEKNGEFLKKAGTDSATNVVSKYIDTSKVDNDEAKIKLVRDSIQKLQKEVIDAQDKIFSFQKKLTDSVTLMKRQINQLNDPASMTDYIDKNDTTEKNRLTKAQNFLLSVDQIGIGRSWINYSELTVKNISLNGLNIEMNPGKLYMAGAAGSVNNQFRDFVLNNNMSTKQSVKLVRFGIGKKNKNNLILTVYGGRKALLNTTGLGDSSGTEKIVGASLAATVTLTKNTSVTGEFARSSYDDVYDPNQTSKGLFSRVINFRLRSNEAWNLKFQSIYPRTNTKIDGSYTQMGAAFESFTIYASNVKQDAYLLHVNQLLWKKKLSIDASIRKNDFNSPLTAPGYSNKAVFKSLQVSLAVPRYPFVSVGYYPTSQLFVGNGNVVYQSWYNTLNTIVSYSYKMAKLDMSTNAVYTKFYNNQTDTSFAYFDATTFTLSHNVFLNPFVFQGNLTVTDQQNIHLVTFEPLVTYKYKNILTLSGSIKWSRLNSIETLWGGSAGVGLLIKNIGTIQLNYDKVHLPAYNGTLMPVDMGRITFNKVF